MTDKKINHCSFCNRHKDEVRKLIIDDDVAICSECVVLCNTLISSDDKTDELAIKEIQEFDAYSIKDHLDKHVVGQDLAKRIISVAITNHYKRINHPPKNLEIQKGNVLLIGPTASGKTLLAKTITKYLNVPFVIVDATNLTEAGYAGDDVETMIAMLLSAADNNIELAERGIVFIDEIDKISRKSEGTSITRDVSGEGVQQALLKIVEGTKCKVSPSGKRKHPQGDTIEIDTKNILFIAGGAFVGLDQIIRSRTQGTTIGFGADIKSKDDIGDLTDISPDDLIRYGMIPEFVGRFTTTVTLEELTLDQLILVLTSVKNSIIDQYKYLFSLDNIELIFTHESIRKIAQNCIDLKTGARGLHTELERILMPAMFHSSKLRDKTIVVEAEHVEIPETLVADYITQNLP